MARRGKKKAKQTLRPENMSATAPQASGPCYIQSLPFETLSEIFKICEHEYRAEQGSQIRIGLTCAISFSLVNKFWRSVACGTWELWTTIRISGPATVKRALIWLKYSGHVNLKVEYVWNKSIPVQGAVDVIQPHLHRIRMLTITMDEVARGTWNVTRHTMPSNLFTSTNIITLRLIGVCFQTNHHALQILQACPDLQHLDLSFSFISGQTWHSIPTPPSHPMLSLPHLESAIFPVSPLTEFLRKSSLTPLLRTIMLNDVDCYMLTPNHIIITSWDDDVTIRLLRVLPDIEGLTLEDRYSDELIEFLATADQGNRFPGGTEGSSDAPLHCFPLPHLRILRLENCREVDFEDLLLRYVEADGVELPETLERIEISGVTRPAKWNQWKKAFQRFGTVVTGDFTRKVAGSVG